VFLIGRHRPATTTAADIAIAAAAPAHTIPRPDAA
jgi:hypothetical protein